MGVIFSNVANTIRLKMPLQMCPSWLIDEIESDRTQDHASRAPIELLTWPGTRQVSTLHTQNDSGRPRSGL